MKKKTCVVRDDFGKRRARVCGRARHREGRSIGRAMGLRAFRSDGGWFLSHDSSGGGRHLIPTLDGWRPTAREREKRLMKFSFVTIDLDDLVERASTDSSIRRRVRSTEDVSQTIVDVISKNVFKIIHRRARTQILERNVRVPTAQRHAHDA